MKACLIVLVIATWQAAVANAAGFSVSGTKILDANGNEFIMRGISHPHSWYKTDTPTAIPAIAATGANIVRVVLSDGEQYYLDEADSVAEIISLCEANKLICMLEVHDATGSDDTSTLLAAVDYWISIKDVLVGHESTVMINIANEWYSQDNADAWSAGYKEAIPKLREAGLTHMLVVDCAGWGQYPDTCAKAGPDVFAADTLSNTIFSIHMYENAGRDSDTVKSNIDNSLATGLPVIVGEFGYTGVAYDTIMEYGQEKSVGWLAWSWYGNNDPILDMASGPTGTLTSWGEAVVDSTYGIKATSKIASVYN